MSLRALLVPSSGVKFDVIRFLVSPQLLFKDQSGNEVVRLAGCRVFEALVRV